MKNDCFRSFFPIFKKNPQLFYFDTAATSLKPKIVIDALTEFYNFNGLSLNNLAPLSLENKLFINQTRQQIANFINSQKDEIIFTKSTTESLNMLAQIISSHIKPQDEIITSELEHNSSVYPWIKIAQQKKAKLVFLPLNQKNQITVANFRKVLSDKTKIIALTHMSNVLGYETPIKIITQLAHQKKALVILDAAQSVGCQKINIQDLDVDFMTFSAHKIYGPFGLGILFGKKHLLKKFNPLVVGGHNIKNFISDKNFIFNDIPDKFEPGTPNIASIIAFQKSLEFIKRIGFSVIHQHNKKIVLQLRRKLKKIPQINILNDYTDHNNIVLFNFQKIHAHDVESFLSQENIYVRTGKHCADLTAAKIKQKSTVRVSVGIHNNEKDVEILIENLKKINKFFNQI